MKEPTAGPWVREECAIQDLNLDINSKIPYNPMK
jgi:hypothetical protein